MLTSALVTDSSVATTWVLYGSPVERRAHPQGSVVLFLPGEVVFYAVRAQRPRAFVFRTLAQRESCSSKLPGVAPEVRLLVQTQTVARLRRLQELLAYLSRHGRSPTTLPDRFYLKLHAILSGRLPQAKVLRSLLDDETTRASAFT